MKIGRAAPTIAIAAMLTLVAADTRAQQECGTILTPDEGAVMAQREQSGVYQLRSGAGGIGGGNWVVPFTFHVVRRSDGTGGLSQDRLDQAVIDANIAYADANIEFCQPGPTVYIDSDAFYFDINTMAEINALRTTNPVPDTINVYFSPNLAYEGGGLCGISAFTTSSVQAIAMLNDCTATDTNHSTFAHEVGHYFDLYHTHEPFFGDECVDGSNCAVAGDLICDTPADPVLGSHNVDDFCNYFGTEFDFCTFDFYDPDPTNLMSYSRKWCRDNFTPMQLSRAAATLVNFRPELALATCPLVGADCGDFDGDGDVDTTDFGVFGQCFGGAFNPPAATCPAGADADCDDDGDVDSADFAIFSQNFTGSQ